MPTSTLIVAVLLNGSPIDFGQVPSELKPQLKDGVVVVPVRPILESIGANVDFDLGPYKTTVTYKGEKTVLETEYSKTVQQVVQLTWPAKDKFPHQHKYSYMAATSYGQLPPGSSKMYRRMMPLGFLANTFNLSLEWDGKKKVVEINTRE